MTVNCGSSACDRTHPLPRGGSTDLMHNELSARSERPTRYRAVVLTSCHSELSARSGKPTRYRVVVLTSCDCELSSRLPKSAETNDTNLK